MLEENKKRELSELEAIESFVNLSYNSMDSTVVVTDGKFSLRNPTLGNCYRYSDSDSVTYCVHTNKLGALETDYKVLIHEYGHIYLGHLDGIHETLDVRVCNIFNNNRGELIERINSECGIDFAERLIERVIDDPELNHTLHNIAMDMEINSKLLSDADIEEMTKEIHQFSVNKVNSISEGLINIDEDKVIADMSTEEKDKLSEEDLKLLAAKELIVNQARIKFILPNKFYLEPYVPFPDKLTYPEYLLMIIKRLDQFVKMLVSIKMGKSGDTSEVSEDDINKALKEQQGDQSEGDEGQGKGMMSLSSLMSGLGMSEDLPDFMDEVSNLEEKSEGDSNSQDETKDENGKSNSEDKSKEEKPCPYKPRKSSFNDHRTESRDKADEKRHLGQIRTGGGVGCGNSPSNATRDVQKEDVIDMALDEILRGFKSNVVKHKTRRDTMFLYNRGINRTVIAPINRNTIDIDTDPTIVFLIDISGSMNSELVDRILSTIADRIMKFNRGLRYNIISWNTSLGEHIKNINPRDSIPRISVGGGTRMAGGIEYFRQHYKSDATLVLISDFEDSLMEWHNIEKTMPEYTMYAFDYGRSRYKQDFTNLKVRRCY